MKKAIIIPYAVDQNEPSLPVRGTFDLSDSKTERDERLLQLFNEYVYSDEDGDVVPTINDVSDDDDLNCDIVVYVRDEVYMFVVILPD